MTDLTDEMVRIMRAINDGTFGVNANGRYIIFGQARPDRRSRELLQKRGLIDWRYEVDRKANTRVLWSTSTGRYVWFVTAKGLEKLGGSSGLADEPGAPTHESPSDSPLGRAQRLATTDTGGDATPSARPAHITFSDPGDGYDSAIRWHADLERGDL